jgi:peptidyl-prolyl cis-trans isomerase C
MKKSMLLPFVVLAGALLAFGCGKDEEAEGPAAGADQGKIAGTGQAVMPADQAGPGGDEVVVRVGDEEIRRVRVDRKTEELLKQIKLKSPNENVEQIRPFAWRQALEDLINQKLLLQEAGKRGLSVDPEDVEDQFNMMISRFPSPEQFQSTLDSIGLSEEGLRAEIEENLLIDRLLDEEVGHDQAVTKKEVADYYKNNPDDFMRPQQVHASHILITVDQTDTPQQKEEKRLRLLDLKKQIEAGADFAEMARTHSDGPSKSKGGDLGFFGRGQMVKPFEDAVFAMQVGELSDIVETKFGYHLIKLLERQEEGKAALAEVDSAIRNVLINRKKQEAVAAYLDSLRLEGRIEYSEGYGPEAQPAEPGAGEGE